MKLPVPAKPMPSHALAAASVVLIGPLVSSPHPSLLSLAAAMWMLAVVAFVNYAEEGGKR